jgi:hypothetical protein
MNIITPEQILLARKRNNEIIIAFPYPSLCNYYDVETASVRFESISLSHLVFILLQWLIPHLYMCAQSNFGII